MFIDIDVKSEAVSTIILQVIAEDGGVELDCDLYVIGNPKPTTFFWVRVGVTQLEETDPSLNLTAQTAGTNEKVMCTAGNSFGMSLKCYIADKMTNTVYIVYSDQIRNKFHYSVELFLLKT